MPVVDPLCCTEDCWEGWAPSVRSFPIRSPTVGLCATSAWPPAVDWPAAVPPFVDWKEGWDDVTWEDVTWEAMGGRWASSTWGGVPGEATEDAPVLSTLLGDVSSAAAAAHTLPGSVWCVTGAGAVCTTGVWGLEVRVAGTWVPIGFAVGLAHLPTG